MSDPSLMSSEATLEEVVAELIGLGGRIIMSAYGEGSPWTEVHFSRRKWTGENLAAVEYADTTPYPQALADILKCAKADIASGALT